MLVCTCTEFQSKRYGYRFHAYHPDLDGIKDRLELVEKRVCELESTIPREMGEWRKLQVVS